jgi:hypothetical protein
VLTVKRWLTIGALLFLLNPLVVSQTPSHGTDCSTLKYSRRHKTSCLCGTVEVCSGDLCGRPSDYGLDDDITVELRDKAGTTTLVSKKAVVEIREKEGTTQDGTKVPLKTKDRMFCFEGQADGDYVFAFVLYKNGVPQPAVKFPQNYSRKRRKPCDAIYMVEPICPK